MSHVLTCTKGGLTRVATTDTVAQERSDEDSGERNHTEEELPLGGLANELLALDFDNGRDDGTREDAVLRDGCPRVSACAARWSQIPQRLF